MDGNRFGKFSVSAGGIEFENAFSFCAKLQFLTQLFYWL